MRTYNDDSPLAVGARPVSHPLSHLLSRREFLKVSSAIVGGLALASCMPSPSSAPQPEGASTQQITVRMITHWTGEDAHAGTMQLLRERFQRLLCCL